MLSTYELKPRFQALLRPQVARLAANGVTANQVTVAAVLVSMVMGALIVLAAPAAWPLPLMPAVLLVRMALNAMDGMLAREFSMKTKLGCVLNELGDVVADCALYLPLALIAGMPATPLVLFVILGVIVEMTGVIAVQIGAERRYDGPFGKSDRAVAISVICLALGLGVPADGWLAPTLWALVALSAATVCNRARRALASGEDR